MHVASVAGKLSSKGAAIQNLALSGVSAICVGISAKLHSPRLTAWLNEWQKITPELILVLRVGRRFSDWYDERREHYRKDAKLILDAFACNEAIDEEIQNELEARND